MNKQELLENYTKKQLAKMMIEKNERIEYLAENLKKVNSDYKRLDKRENYLQDELRRYKSELQHKETTINQIDDILNELFGVTHDDEKPGEFKEILKDKIKNSKTISGFIPAEPIKVADLLINAEYAREKGTIEKSICKAFGNDSDTITEKVYSVSELRQIAEHLLVYCNANGEGEE